MFGLPDIHVKYRIDKRIKIAEVSAGNVKFITSLETFMKETSIRDFEETRGEAFIGTDNFLTLQEGKL